VDIRKATTSDVERIAACARAAYAMYVERIGREPAPMVADFATQVQDGHIYVISDEESIFGYVVLYSEGDQIHLENVAVQPEYKGQGIGGRLIAFVEVEARRRGFVAVELYTNEKMFENLDMYPKHGYVEIDRRTVDGFARVFFRKTVDALDRLGFLLRGGALAD